MSRHLLQKIWRLPRLAVKQFMTALLRGLLLLRRPARLARSGYVLPTTALLVLMVLLTATALTYRAFTRSDQAITQREQQVIVNAATPAIDRAKAKIEFIFQNDPRFPSGIPASDRLADLMANERAESINNTDPDLARWTGYTKTIPPLIEDQDPYTLPDEERVDINGDGELDNAWKFETDIDGDGTINAANEIIVYSILVDDIGPEDIDPDDAAAVALTNPDADAKADALVTRTGPLATTEPTDACGGALAEGGWQIVTAGDNSTLQKNFQVNVFVANSLESNRTYEAMEFQQSRIAARASKWGAWFRYDLEIHPGPDFKFNGAMHTDGNLVLNGSYTPYMVSSFNSCVYTKEASEITLGAFDNVEYADEDGLIDITKAEKGVLGDFQGQVIRAKTDGNSYTTGDTTTHVFDTKGTEPTTSALNRDNDSVDQASSVPSDVAMNPLILFTQDKESHIDPETWTRDEDWDDTAANAFLQNGKERIFNQIVDRPFVDDFFRADDRWGPKPRYTASDEFDVTNRAVTIGDEITGEVTLTGDTDGYDGYWERQAIAKGLRLIVGERLELGNPYTWGYNPTTGTIDPSTEALYPHTDDAFDNTGITVGVHGGPHQRLHRKSLQDNLAAVQTMAIYHYQGGGTNGMATDGEFPLACYALTAHPGTQQTIIDSRTFDSYTYDTTKVKLDFFNGQGTNGWEFAYNASFDDPTEFGTAIADGQPLGDALRNLAYFAGDPRGGAPSFPPVQGVQGDALNGEDADGVVHPYPELAMWGDFSMLRRVLAKVDGGTAYADLSFADQATLHTAACTVSALAYSVDGDRREFNSILSNAPSSVQSVSTQLGTAIQTVMDCMEASDPLNASSGGGNACSQGSFDADVLLQNLILDGYSDPVINSSGESTWVDPNPASELTYTAPDGTTTTVCAAGTDVAGFQTSCDSAEFFQDWTFENWLELIQAPGALNTNAYDQNDADNNGTADGIDDIVSFAESINTYQDLTRDRDLGFRDGASDLSSALFSTASGAYVVYNADGTTEPVAGFQQGNTTTVFQTGCNPNIFQNLGATGAGGQDNVVTLGLVICSKTDQTPIRYPSLYYLFPVVNHDHDGDGDHLQPNGTYAQYGVTNYTEEYVGDAYIGNATNGVNRSGSVTYSVVGTDSITGVSEIAAVPKNIDGTTGWVIPTNTTSLAALSTPDTEPFRITLPSGNGANVAFLDKGIFNGLQMLNTRVLDIDLDALTTEVPDTGFDYWLSANLDEDARGVVYAFREDAVREDEIVRPKSSDTITVADCMALDKKSGSDTRVFELESDTTCFMNADPALANVQDPPLTDELISLKPVDFVGDPQRRAHGFRLRTASGNPADFSGGDPDDGRQVGMTFVTDNSLYVQGDFNPHSSDGSVDSANLLEEFTQKILGGDFTFDEFYEDRVTLNTSSFANLDVDHWRPVELLADSITVLSNNFTDGDVEKTYTGDGTTSYENQTRIEGTSASADWVHSNPDSATSPVWVDRNGVYYTSANEPYYTAYPDDAAWRLIDEGKTLIGAAQTYLNATFVTGVTPKRANQGYGGLHNFPRFLENWGGTNLFIQGSFIQLNFSTASTGPYEQETFEPGDIPDGGEWIRFYNPPNRRWGYDVGLLYVPPAPAAERFVTIETPRSEYYREVPADDPYIVNLRCAVDAAGDQILPDLCPS